MSEDKQGRPVVVEYETLSGVMIHITPLSIFTINAVTDRAEEMFPYPDPLPYEMPIENAVDGVKAPANQNPEYQELCRPIDAERMEWRVTVSIDLACAFPAFDSRDAMLARYRPALEKLRRVAVLPEDDWQAVLLHCVFTGRGERQTVLDIATQSKTIPLTPGEVVDGIRFFRAEIPGQTA